MEDVHYLVEVNWFIEIRGDVLSYFDVDTFLCSAGSFHRFYHGTIVCGVSHASLIRTIS